MIKERSGFLLGIGSNIEPHTNIQAIISALSHRFEHIHLSRVLSIPPIGMNSHRDFLNVVVFIETDLNQQEVKTYCNDIEAALGRDRSDPNRKTKDRTADLDILTEMRLPADQARSANSITDEYFLYPLIDELVAYLCGETDSLKQVGECLQIDDLSFGQSATTINRNTGTSDKRVAQ
jgi:2-amino-4-hydroxy-6-hydroxymethyldihydropteridine diphosphokinase